jgi:hypothetical protein
MQPMFCIGEYNVDDSDSMERLDAKFFDDGRVVNGRRFLDARTT